MILVEEIKIRLGITGNYHDELLARFADDVKAFMVSGGVPKAVVESDISVGVIARGVADLWNLGAGDGKFSQVFFQRLGQLVYESEGSE